MKRYLFLATVLTGLSVALTASAATPPTLVIHHQQRGCHSWSLKGGPMKVVQSVRLAKGGSLVITNDDVMFHKLVKISGPAASYKITAFGTSIKHAVKLPWAPGMMGRPGATLRVTFPTKGTYVFKTVFGEDWMPMPDTIGEDNTLRLVVTVS
jgi:hypothetical protein